MVQPQVQLLEQFELTLKKPGTTAGKQSVAVWPAYCMPTEATSAVVASRTSLQVWHGSGVCVFNTPDKVFASSQQRLCNVLAGLVE